MFSPPQRQLLQAISEHGPRSRTELAAMMRMSKAAVSGFTRSLLERGMLLETETVQDGVGRPSIRLGLDPGCAYFLGVSIAQSPMPLILADLAGQPVAQHSIPWSRDPNEIAAGIARGVTAMVGDTRGIAGRLRGIGIALPGFVDERQLVCIQSTIMGWENVALAAIVQAQTRIVTAIENDANAVAIGERLFGEAKNRSSFSLVSLGEGIGCAHVIDGRLHRGHDGGAGEIAHGTIEPGGLPCRCGKRGCLDTIASLPAILGAARDQGLPAGNLNDLERVASEGDATAIRILHRAGTALGLAIAQVIQINNPGRIVIAHADGVLDGLLGTVMRQAIAENILPRFRESTEIALRHVTSDVWARGAASIAAHRFLSDAVAEVA